MELRDRDITVVGMGRTALALVRLLLREGAKVFVSESAEEAKVADAANALREMGVAFETGQHTLERFTEADVVAPSPGVSWSIEPLQAAIKNGVPVVSELEIASQFCAAPVIAVTGTNGKTTTTEMIRVMLEAGGARVALSGNNACPLSEAVLGPQPDVYVVEASSYQLDGIQTFRPAVSVWLNLSPDHLSRHGSLEGYGKAKAAIFRNQTPEDAAVLNAADPLVWQWANLTNAKLAPFSAEGVIDKGFGVRGEDLLHNGQPFAKTSDVPLPGHHNLANALAALAAVNALRYPLAPALSALRTFQGVEHRIERVAAIGGVTYFNDSKSTNVDSLRVALESFTGGVTLIAGGRGKGEGYDSIAPLLEGRVTRVITLGEDAARMEAAWSATVSCERASDMEDAVRRAASAASGGGTVLLSPGCASFDMYNNFEERGRHFKALVRAMNTDTRESEVQHAT